MERRGFLRGLTAALGPLPFLAEVVLGAVDRLERLAADVSSAAGPAERWRRVRQEFQLHPGFVHLNCGSLGATPQLVVDAVTAAMREIEGNPAGKMFGWGEEQMEVVRARVAAFVGADLDEVAFTRNTTEAMNAVAGGIDLQPGDQVLTTNHEHGGGMVCWQHLRRHRGVEIVYFEMPRRVTSRRQLVDLVRTHLTPRVKVCSFSHIDTITGVRMPLAEIAAITRPREILLVCDGAQAPGMVPVDVHTLGVDTYAFSGHKWMLAPKGSGLLYIRKEVQEQIHPMFLYDGYRGYTASSGTRNAANILGQLATMDFHEAIGRGRIVARCRELSLYMRSRLGDIPGLRILTPEDPGLSGALLTCALEHADGGVLVRRLNQEHQILVKRAQSTFAYCAEDNLPRDDYNAMRFSTHVFNDEADIDRAVDVLRKLLSEATPAH